MNTELLHHYEQYLLLEQGLSPNTREAYTRDLRRFLDYAQKRGVDALDVDLPLLEDYVHSLFEAGIAASRSRRWNAFSTPSTSPRPRGCAITA